MSFEHFSKFTTSMHPNHNFCDLFSITKVQSKSYTRTHFWNLSIWWPSTQMLTFKDHIIYKTGLFCSIKKFRMEFSILVHYVLGKITSQWRQESKKAMICDAASSQHFFFKRGNSVTKSTHIAGRSNLYVILNDFLNVHFQAFSQNKQNLIGLSDT